MSVAELKVPWWLCGKEWLQDKDDKFDVREGNCKTNKHRIRREDICEMVGVANANVTVWNSDRIYTAAILG